MNYGDLTSKEKLILEERTAFLVILAGVVVQESLPDGEGVAIHRLYKILSNAIIDWHWLSYLHPEKFNFNGIGELVWIPHKLGALGQIVPSIEYVSIKLHFSLFPNFVELFKSTIYNKYGIKEIKSINNQTHIYFPRYVDYKTRCKSKVEDNEQHYWERLVKIYAALDYSTLDAMASCRTKTLATHNLWVLFVLWKRYMGFAIDKLRQENGLSLSDAKKKKLIDDINTARECIKQQFILIDYSNNLINFTNAVKQTSSKTEFGTFIPLLEDIAPSFSDKFDTFVKFAYVLESLHDICREFQIWLGLDSCQHKPDLNTLENKLDYIGRHLPIDNSFIETKNWHSRFLHTGTRKEIADSIFGLIVEVFRLFEEALELRFERPSGHYTNFLKNHYPLPNNHFIRGN